MSKKYTITSSTITIKDDMGEKNRVTFYADGRIKVHYFEGTKMFLKDRHDLIDSDGLPSIMYLSPAHAIKWLQSKGLFIEPTILRQTPKQEPGQRGGSWDDPDKGDTRK